LPGGGAEIFAARVRQKICHDKCDGPRYLSIHRIAHGLGMRTNVTMLYGHIETIEERVDHLLQTRALQDDTGGLQAFIPLACHPDNNQMRKLPPPSASETLKVHAVARLMLDSVDHIKAYWISCGVEVAQTALWLAPTISTAGAGGDDLPHGRIVNANGAVDDDIEQLIWDAGRGPIERDTLYNVVRVLQPHGTSNI
jgi:aminodeoxyfutalosine synthase